MSGRRPPDAARQPVVEARGLSFRYDETLLFDGLDLRIAAGEMLALIGPNGSGKTTLLKVLAGALRPASGDLRIEGRPIRALGARDRARVIGVVPQESRMIFDYTVMETVLMGRTPYIGFWGLEGADDVEAAVEALRVTGTLPFAGRLLSRLSGGERQLVLIARALAQQPRILMLDEPTSFLDIRHRQDIFRLLRRLNRERGMTILTTSHDINLVARHCPRMILIKAGRLRADGPPREVFSADLLTDLYDTPMRVTADAETGAPYAVPPED